MAGRIPPEIIDRIRESTDIVDLISGYVQLEKKGGNYFGLCPFHPEKTPSFSVHPGKGIFHCFGCGLGGNVFTFLMEHDKLSFSEAARELAQHLGIEIKEDSPVKAEKYDALYQANDFACEFYSRCLWEGKYEEFGLARQYLDQREISSDLAKNFRVGYAPDKWDGLIKGAKTLYKDKFNQRDFVDAGLLLSKDKRVYDRFRGRLIFPILNLSGKPVGFGGRALKEADESAKYINTPQTAIYNKGALLYGLHLGRDQIRKRGECLVVEGYTDLMRLHEAGFTHSVATSGTALTQDQARLLRRFCRKVILIFDGDSAGSHAALRGGDVLLSSGIEVKVVGLPEGYDPNDFILKEGVSAFGEIVEKATDVFSYRIELYRKENRLSDVPSRSEVARDIITSLAVIPDSIRREMTAQEAARQIGLSQETILRELNRAIRRTGSRQQQIEKKDSYANLPDYERGLLEALIRWPELRSAAFAEVSAQSFQNPMLQRILSRLNEYWLNGEEPAGEELIEEETEMEDARFISYTVSQTESLTDPHVDPIVKKRYDDYVYANDCLRKIKISQQQSQEQRLKAELSKKPPIERVMEIQKEIKTLKDVELKILNEEYWEIPPHPSMNFEEQQAQLNKKKP
ncbi:DNA primase [candidate division LCP-89 bacterium B3_LCP]|uniref:DNA primase n=1 Tax=candidate division LCP-89 bacterium B3_LCP TaxID=2012998 RepID=A0A532V1L9_UNCL8|nr:MAG: DNA primase [candidate division LCP-89 bacterium B3_LCP]